MPEVLTVARPSRCASGLGLRLRTICGRIPKANRDGVVTGRLGFQPSSNPILAGQDQAVNGYTTPVLRLCSDERCNALFLASLPKKASAHFGQKFSQNQRV
jgi:hypothetical protein